MSTRSDRADRWRQAIAEQSKSGLSIREFCRQKALREPSFYWWRRHLEEHKPVRFALVEASGEQDETRPTMEVILAGGDRIRVIAGLDATALREVIQALRG